MRRVVIIDLLPVVPLKLRSQNATSDSNKSYAFTQPYGRGLLDNLSSLRLRSYKPKTHLSALTCRRLSERLPFKVLFVNAFEYFICTNFNTTLRSCQPFETFFQKNQSPLRCAIFLRFSQLMRADSKTSSGVESCSMMMYSIPVSRQAL